MDDKLKEAALTAIHAAYFEGWKAGAETGESDSPDWNAEEDLFFAALYGG